MVLAKELHHVVRVGISDVVWTFSSNESASKNEIFNIDVSYRLFTSQAPSIDVFDIAQIPSPIDTYTEAKFLIERRLGDPFKIAKIVAEISRIEKCELNIVQCEQLSAHL